jgi:hypothetical protein
LTEHPLSDKPRLFFPTAFEALVIEDEAAPILEQDLAAVSPTPEEDEEVAAVQIELPLSVDDGRQPVVAEDK